MSAPVVLEPVASALLRRAQEWRLAGLLFERPRAGWPAEVARLAAAIEEPLLKQSAEQAAQASEGSYLAALGPGGAAAAREAGYRSSLDPARLLATLAEVQSAFGFAPQSEDPPDHVSQLCGLAGWLALKQAYALASGEAEAAEITARAAADVEQQHLAALAQALRAALESSGPPHLLLAARWLHAQVGDRPADLEGGWVPTNLDRGGCASSCGSGTEESCDDGILAGIAEETRPR